MSLFLLTFFLLYGGVHAYAFVKARNALGFGPLAGVLLCCFMAAMVLAPVTVRIAEKHGFESFAKFAAYSGYTWMGFLFLFFSASIAIDIYRGILFVAERISHRDLEMLALSARTAFIAPVVWGCVISVYGVFEANNIVVERVVVKSAKLPPGMMKLTIVQVSDVHLGLIVREGRVAKIVQRIRQANPDLLVSTGDLVDGQIDGLSALARMFGEIRPPFGKFAITGNHEFYAGLKPSLSVTEEAGFTVLRGESRTVAGGVTIAGVDDPAGHRGSATRGGEHELLAGLPRDRFTLLLKHRPKVDEESLGLFDLQLSGHVHKGQIFPFNLLTHLFYPVKMGLSRYPRDSLLYVSRGTGTWGPPIRFLSPPEVTLIEVVTDGR